MPSRCVLCDKEFVDRKAYLNHKNAKHPKSAKRSQQRKKEPSWLEELENSLANPVSNEGYWVRREAFHGRKSFGAFRCNPCQATWISAHAYPKYHQDCKNCRESHLPACLWVNVHSGDSSSDSEATERGQKKPHHKDKCEACRRGVCDAL
jgi:hypothetical protein